MTSLWRGLALGFSIAAVVGPISILCIQRTLTLGRRVGLASGLGAATADALYASLAAFSLVLVTRVLLGARGVIESIGGIALILLGAWAWRAPVDASATPDRFARTLLSAYSSTFLLTLANPMTILSFAAAFAGFGVRSDGSWLGALSFVAGVLLGSSLWWLLLSSVVAALRQRLTTTRLRWVHRIAAALLIGFGLLSLLHTRR